MKQQISSANPEQKRLDTEKGEEGYHPWLKWGPYLSERSWGTVREDFSKDGNAWEYFPHEHARSKAYRAGEDGLAGISDLHQRINFSLALWNKKDPILKERIFGLVPTEGNHGEDVKEYYFYLDSTPTHSYMKYLYKYGQEAYPYEQLIQENKNRGLEDREFELIDTGIFEENRYFDVFVEYAKESPSDIGIRITLCNRGEQDASLYLLPQLWFRNTWSWDEEKASREPSIKKGLSSKLFASVVADGSSLQPPSHPIYDYRLGSYYFYAEGNPEILFTNNETHAEKVFGEESKSRSPYTKDAFHRHLIEQEDCLSPKQGTKMCFHYGDVVVPAKGEKVFYLRLSDSSKKEPFSGIEKLFSKRIQEADTFYEGIHPKKATEDEKRIQRQAFAGMLWSKQYYEFNVHKWLKKGYFNEESPKERETIRNGRWHHLDCKKILSMPDKWEYPWFAAWDLALHTIVFSQIDIQFAKEQLWNLLFEEFFHPSGQIPAYEWEFSDLNPPVHAWAVWNVYSQEKKKTGKGDLEFLNRCYQKLLMNFCWWVNKVDKEGHNIFEGGFLGLDNISVIDRSETLPSGEEIEQSDGTGWMGMFSLQMMRMSLELSHLYDFYEPLAVKFFEHFVLIAASMETHNNRKAQMWNEEDGFFYDVVSYPDGSHVPLKVRSQVGLVPLFSIDYFKEEKLKKHPYFYKNFKWYLKHRSHLTDRCITKQGDNYIFSMMHFDQMQSLLRYVWDPKEFRSDYGLRSLSKYHQEHPFYFEGKEVDYEPGEATMILKGGNSNWRGPIWFPTAYILIQALRRLDEAVKGKLKVSVEGEKSVSPGEIAQGLSQNLLRLFTKDSLGRRPVHGDYETFQKDPHFKDLLLFYEHYHGETGRGLGANHQTGWSGLIAKIIEEIYEA